MKGNKGLLGIFAVLLISLVVTAALFFTRWKIESENKQVEIVLDYGEFEEMAKQSDQTLSWWLKFFKEQGITQVALKEETLHSLVNAGEPLTVTMLGNLVKELNWQQNYPQSFVASVDPENYNPHAVVVYTESEELYNFIANALETRYPEERFAFYPEGDRYTIVIQGTAYDALYTENIISIETSGKSFANEYKLSSSKLTRLGLGLDPEKVKLIQDSGMEVMARPFSYGDWSTEKQVQATLAEYEAMNIHPDVYIFDGQQVLGFPNALDPVAAHMREAGVKVGLIETGVQRQHIEQDGIEVLTDAVEYRGVRIYSLQPYIQLRFRYEGYDGAQEIENTLYRAITERNIRLIYFKPFKYDKYQYVPLAEEYAKMFQSLRERLAEHQITLGNSSTFPPRHIRIRHYTLMGWGVAAVGVLLLNRLFNLKTKLTYLLLGITLVGVPAMFFVVPSIADKVLALMAAILFASLSMAYFCHEAKKIFAQGEHKSWGAILPGVIKGVVVTTLISIVGAMYVATILSDVKYLLEMDIYRGVKIAQLLPFIPFILFYLKEFSYGAIDEAETKSQGVYWEVRKLLLADIKVIYVIIGAFVAFAGYIYLARTGHETTVQASTLEIMLRNLLENTFMARPRFKEFLIGIPFLTMGYFVAKRGYRKLIFPAGFVAVLGQTSIINTFSHLRTPLYLSLIRTLYGLAFGLIIGLIGAVALEVLIKLVAYSRKKLGIQSS